MSRSELNVITDELAILPDESTGYTPPTPEELRANMVVSAAQARLNLKAAGLLTAVNTAINALSQDDDMRILWEYSTELHRLNPVLVGFCTTTLGLNDSQIDGLFT